MGSTLSFPALTGGSSHAADAWHYYVQQLLGYGANLRALFAAADENPDCLLLNAHAACLHLAFEGREGWSLAEPYLRRMQDAMATAEPHEQATAQAVNAWAMRDFPRASAAFEEISNQWTDDLAALKWGQYHAFNLGDHAALLRLGRLAVSRHDAAPYAHGLLAFALEQTHDLTGAEREANRALEITSDDAWAHHALAHVMETEGRIEEGTEWLTRHSESWAHKGTFIREHNWWHLALFHLRHGDAASVLDIFDKRLWGEWPEFPQEQIGAISMLWRLELAGHDVGERWMPVVEQARDRCGDHLYPFHDLHYLFALARAGRSGEATSFLRSLGARAQTACSETTTGWDLAALPAAQGIIAFATGDCRNAVEKLQRALPYLQRIGGSHAQRDIFHATLNAAIAERRIAALAD